MNLAELIAKWEAAQSRVEHLQRELHRASTDLTTATNALGKHLTPTDAKPEEVFSVWHEGRLLEAYHPKRVWYGTDGTDEERHDPDFAIRVRETRKHA